MVETLNIIGIQILSLGLKRLTGLIIPKVVSVLGSMDCWRMLQSKVYCFRR